MITKLTVFNKIDSLTSKKLVLEYVIEISRAYRWDYNEDLSMEINAKLAEMNLALFAQEVILYGLKRINNIKETK